MGKQRTDWWVNSDNVLALANELVDAGYLGVSRSPDKACKELLYYFSKPWKWSPEWEWFEKHKTMEGFIESQG